MQNPVVCFFQLKGLITGAYQSAASAGGLGIIRGKKSRRTWEETLNFNLIILSKPKCIVILTGLFCSVVASGTSHFYSFSSVNDFGRS